MYGVMQRVEMKNIELCIGKGFFMYNKRDRTFNILHSIEKGMKSVE